MSATHRRQMLGSLLAALAVAATAVAIVTAKFGPTSEAEREAAEERRDQVLEDREEAREAAEERREEERER